MAKDIQNTVLDIINFAQQQGLPSIRKAKIMAEVRKTSLKKYDGEQFKKDDKETKLERMVDQALYQLKKNNKIKKVEKDEIKKVEKGWTIVNDTNHYKICSHLEKKDARHYCPIKECFITDYKNQCGVRNGSNSTEKGWTNGYTPKCPGYTDRASTKVSRKFSKELIENKKNQKAVEIAKQHDISYDEALKYIKKYHPEWED